MLRLNEQPGGVKVDYYAKIVLTVVAGSLLLLNIQLMRNVDFINNAHAVSVQRIAICNQFGTQCAKVDHLGISVYNQGR